MGLFSREQDMARPPWLDDGGVSWTPKSLWNWSRAPSRAMMSAAALG